jgi:DNA-binding NarL/FixJ family response regulator
MSPSGAAMATNRQKVKAHWAASRPDWGLIGPGSSLARAKGWKARRRKRVLGMHADGLSYRPIARNVGLSKNTVMNIVRRNSAS